MAKSLVCTCEDVTVEDVRAAIAKGYRDIESIKRYTGFGTGLCQGKSCQVAVARLLAQEGALPVERLAPFTPRPPLSPTPLRLFSAGVVDPRAAPGEGVPPGLELATAAAPPERPLPQKAEVVIIGGGILGLALAYNLAKRGTTDLVVLEQSYLCAGASGRNGGGVRMQWSTRGNVELARRSIEICKGFARELGLNVWFRAGGYLFLAPTKEHTERLERNAKLHHELGVPTEMLSPQGARDLVPELDTSGVVAAAYNPHDGVIFPWPFLWGYAAGAERLGVRIETFTRVEGLATSAGRVTEVKTSRGAIRCERVVNAAGAWSPQIAAMAGVTLPNEPYRHEILVTEPLKPFLRPLVSLLGSGLYFSQSGRGEIVGGMGDPNEPAGLQMGSTLRFLFRFSQTILKAMPILGEVKVLRQWAGCYDVTPDNQPILGPTPGLSNLVQLNGFGGHGFMMAPAMGERAAAYLCGEPDEFFSRFNLSRFAEGRSEREDFIIG
jgi:sarcosine oxidase subunit beta